jgi:hypothetical protein
VKRQQSSPNSSAIALGAHYTLMYEQTSSGEKHFSSLAEILQWIKAGPILQQPASQNRTDTPITMPIYVPATLQYVPIQATLSLQQSQVEKQKVSNLDEVEKQRVCDLNANKRTDKVISNETKKLRKQRLSVLNEVQRKASAISIGPRTNKTLPRRSTHLNPPVGQQRVSERLRLLGAAHHTSLHDGFRPHDDASRFTAPKPPPGFENLTIDEDIERFRLLVERDDPPSCRAIMEQEFATSCLATTTDKPDTKHISKPMPNDHLPPVFPTRPLNLNEDGSTINYKKSHSGPHAEYWAKADAEEIERLFVTGTIAPIYFRDIPPNSGHLCEPRGEKKRRWVHEVSHALNDRWRSHPVSI